MFLFPIPYPSRNPSRTPLPPPRGRYPLEDHPHERVLRLVRKSPGKLGKTHVCRQTQQTWQHGLWVVYGWFIGVLICQLHIFSRQHTKHHEVSRKAFTGLSLSLQMPLSSLPKANPTHSGVSRFYNISRYRLAFCQCLVNDCDQLIFHGRWKLLMAAMRQFSIWRSDGTSVRKILKKGHWTI